MIRNPVTRYAMTKSTKPHVPRQFRNERGELVRDCVNCHMRSTWAGWSDECRGGIWNGDAAWKREQRAREREARA